jgi:tetratricopeptide (TPR) repeat protein
MEWTPITFEELDRLIKGSEALLSGEEAKFWNLLKVVPHKWQQHPWGDEGGGFWVVGVMGNKVIYYNDIEEGFNISTFKIYGAIEEYFCNQSELQKVIYSLTASEAKNENSAKGYIFPKRAIEVLRHAEYDPAAKLAYELLSGSIDWSDECHDEFSDACRTEGCSAHGYPFAYRTSLLIGQPREELRAAWNELLARCPEWIGFRPERTTPNPEFYREIISRLGDDELQNVCSLPTQAVSDQTHTIIRRDGMNCNWKSLNDEFKFLYQAGKIRPAAEVAEKAMNAALDEFGLEHPDIATALNNLAIVSKDLEEYDKAESLFNRALEIRKKLYGCEHQLVAQSLNNLGDLFLDKGEYDRAEVFLSQALEIKQRVLGESDAAVVPTLNNMAMIHLKREHYALAEPFFKKALAIHESLATPDDVSVACIFNNLAFLYSAQKQYSEAEKYYLKALGIYESAYGAKNHVVLEVLGGMLSLYSETGDAKKAANIKEKMTMIFAS